MIITIITTVIVTLISVAFMAIFFRPISEFICFIWMAWRMGAFSRTAQAIALIVGLFLGFLWGSYYEKKTFSELTRDQRISVQRENINNAVERTENADDTNTRSNRTSP